MNNKYNIGERVMFKGAVCFVFSIRDNLYKYELLDSGATIGFVKESSLTPYIEEDIQEGETQDEISLPESPYIYEDGVLRYNESTSIYLCPICNEEIKYNFYGSEFGFICEECNDKKIPQTTTTIDSIPNVKDSGTILHSYPSEHDSSPIGLDYEKEYYESMSEHAETKELLEIAKVALKLTTELISTNE